MEPKAEKIKKQDKDLDKALADTFPASDPPSMSEPGSSVVCDDDACNEESENNKTP